MAGLPCNRAIVCVGPPLLCNGPSNGFVFFLSPEAVNPVAGLSLMMLLPCEVIVAPLTVATLTGVFPLIIVFLTLNVGVPVALSFSIPAPLGAVLLAIVQFNTVTDAVALLRVALYMPPSPAVALFPETVLLVIVTTPLPLPVKDLLPMAPPKVPEF